MAARRAEHPRFFAALIGDARTTASYRAERFEFHGRADALMQALRLMWVSDAFAAHALYRAKARMQALGIPILPRYRAPSGHDDRRRSASAIRS